MGKKSSSSKKMKMVHQEIDSASKDDDIIMDNEEILLNHEGREENEYGFDDDDLHEDENEDEYDNDDEEGEDDDVDEDEDEDGGEEEEMDEAENEERTNEEIKELEKEYLGRRHEEQYLLKNLKHQKDEDLLKGEAVKNQKALWDKTLEFRFLLQKVFSSSNRLPQEPIRSTFCEVSNETCEAYTDLISSSKKTLESILELQEALLEKNPYITQGQDGNRGGNTNYSEVSNDFNDKGDQEWQQISEMYSRMATFRDKSIDKWQRKTQLTTGAAAIKGKLQAFNQNVSTQVAGHMRDPTRMIKGMQQRRSIISVFGTVPDSSGNTKEEVADADGDPELLDDSEFYQQLLKEFFETIDSSSSEMAFYALKRLQTKKRKVVDRRASKNRKIRYNVHEKMVNFMAQPMDLPPMAPKLFENLFGLKKQKAAALA